MCSSLNIEPVSLTTELRTALRELENRPIQHRLPSEEAKSLLELGLAELSCGHLTLTPAGHRTLTLLRNGHDPER